MALTENLPWVEVHQLIQDAHHPHMLHLRRYDFRLNSSPAKTPKVRERESTSEIQGLVVNCFSACRAGTEDVAAQYLREGQK